MNFPISIDRSSQFQILGVFSGIFHFYSNAHTIFCKQTVETLIRRRFLSSAADLGLHCLHMSHKKDTRLIWVNRISVKLSILYVKGFRPKFDKIKYFCP